MQANISLIEPNMAMMLSNHELRFYNLIYDEHDKQSKTGYGNFLLQRYSDASIPLTAYPTITELQTQVASLDYDGINFWSVQAINDTPYYPGFILRKWAIDTTQYGLRCVQFKCFPGPVTARALTAEYYNFPLKTGVGTDRNYIEVDKQYSWIIDRLRVGQQIKVGPNIHGEIFWGTITTIVPYTEWPDPVPLRYIIQFGPREYFPTSHVMGENCFVSTRLFIIDSSGTLNELDTTTLNILKSSYKLHFTNTKSLTFSVVKNVMSINLGNLTQALFTVTNNVIYCYNVRDISKPVMAKSIPDNAKNNGNAFLSVEELRIRNDDYTDINNHPQLYSLQKEYIENNTVKTWSVSHSEDYGARIVLDYDSYNYLTYKLEAQPSFMAVYTNPNIILPSGLVSCSCSVLDDYRFPVSNVQVTWSVTPAGSGKFIGSATTITNSSGIAYITFSGAGTITFPTYITASAAGF